jgi:hypothetical protein
LERLSCNGLNLNLELARQNLYILVV